MKLKLKIKLKKILPYGLLAFYLFFTIISFVYTPPKHNITRKELEEINQKNRQKQNDKKNKNNQQLQQTLNLEEQDSNHTLVKIHNDTQSQNRTQKHILQLQFECFKNRTSVIDIFLYEPLRQTRTFDKIHEINNGTYYINQIWKQYFLYENEIIQENQVEIIQLNQLWKEYFPQRCNQLDQNQLDDQKLKTDSQNQMQQEVINKYNNAWKQYFYYSYSNEDLIYQEICNNSTQKQNMDDYGMRFNNSVNIIARSDLENNNDETGPNYEIGPNDETVPNDEKQINNNDNLVTTDGTSEIDQQDQIQINDNEKLVSENTGISQEYNKTIENITLIEENNQHQQINYQDINLSVVQPGEQTNNEQILEIQNVTAIEVDYKLQDFEIQEVKNVEEQVEQNISQNDVQQFRKDYNTELNISIEETSSQQTEDNNTDQNFDHQLQKTTNITLDERQAPQLCEPINDEENYDITFLVILILITHIIIFIVEKRTKKQNQLIIQEKEDSTLTDELFELNVIFQEFVKFQKIYNENVLLSQALLEQQVPYID